MYDLRHCHGGFVILCQSWVSRNEELLVRRVCKRKVLLVSQDCQPLFLNYFRTVSLIL